MRNNPRRRDLVPQMPNRTPQHRPSLRTHTMPGCRSPFTEGRTDGDPLGLPRGPRRWRARAGTPVAPTCRRSCRQGRAPGQSSAPTATAGGREWAGRSPSRRGTRAQVPAAPQPHAGVRLSRLSRPVPPAVRPLPPASLGFLPEETREEAPRSRRQGCGGEGEAGNATARAIFGPCCQPSSRNGRPGAWRSHAWAGACLNISPAVVSLPCAILHCSQSWFSQRPPRTHTRQPLPSSCPDPREPPHGAADPWQGPRSGIPTSPTGTRRAPCWPSSCWLLSHLAISPGALCQQMHRKHLFPTQGRRGWKRAVPPTTQDLTPSRPALQPP